MTKNQLKELLNTYKKAEQEVFDLDTIYGIRIWDSYRTNFYNRYNLIIHKLFLEIFGESKTEKIEDYLFDQVEIDFEDLCNDLNITENE